MGLNLFLTENTFSFDSFNSNFEELHKVLRGLLEGNKKSLLSEVSPEGTRGVHGLAANTIG